MCYEVSVLLILLAIVDIFNYVFSFLLHGVLYIVIVLGFTVISQKFATQKVQLI